MKNILTKIPGFIYSLIVLSFLLIYFLTFVLNNMEPENHSSKILFSLAIFLTSMVTIPTTRTLFLILEQEEYIDLREKFRSFFAGNVFFSFLLSFLILLKTYGFFNFTTLISTILIYLGVSFAYFKLRKPRRVKRI